MKNRVQAEQYWNQMVPEITVANFNKSLEFYTTILGFQIRFTREEPSFAYLYQETAQLMIEEYHSEGWNIEPLDRPFGRGVNFQIELEEIESIYKRIIESETPLFQEIEESWYQTNEELTGQREFLVQDPDGYLLRFCEVLENEEKV
jgi:catechol 2,3-dioxygenase-like lactoylglutathione lyase family enzyme